MISQMLIWSKNRFWLGGLSTRFIDLLKRLHVEYNVQDIIITENGCSYSDGPDENKTINDTKRIEYHKSHVEQIQIAVNDGIPCTGYFAWSFMDNFEWAEGYSQRFGLIWVDLKP